MWNDDDDIKKTVAIMDPQTKYYYQKMAEKLYDSIDQHVTGPAASASASAAASASADVVNESREFDSATQIDLMLRDGMSVELLSDAERAVYVNVFGSNRLDKYI